MPETAAAISLSRTARKARPVRPSRRLRASSKRTKAQAAVQKKSHWSAVSARPAGAPGLTSRMPRLPWVRSVHFFRICGVETASAKVASARCRPERRRAGSPNRRPSPPVRSPAPGIVSQYGTSQWSIIVAVPERELAAVAGEEVQAEDHDRVDRHELELVQPVVRENEGERQQGAASGGPTECR